ncbi:S41 family peptidase [Aurantiacibacter gangjinensis]|uniref:Peptidase S41 n=1 Tax=Aurantiacibacter gangjinensis TaxID=502682 RepID=A0A0G9MML7_9SPHN|nr:S41 family peptidase [Aurantiacibacter gangjinensis]APE27997.1 Carboxyl-terminal protease [Aurantiacibacter gangjinensis]KLE31935.1 peptidase S41 [Aurantiacibacter gangjinensis]
MRTSKIALTMACAAMTFTTAACGGDDSPSPTATVAPPTTSGCGLDAQRTFVRSVVNEWYLFPNLVDTGVNASNFNDAQDYLDALVRPAREDNRDRFFSYLTSIEAENAFFNGGSSAGFGFRLIYDTVNRRVFIAETFDNTPALAANIERGTEIIAIGTSSTNQVTVNSLMASGGPQAVVDALGPSDPGVTRVLDIVDADGNDREVSISKTEYDLDPVPRYGAQIINDGGKQVGYLRLTNFINPAIDELADAFADFRAAGVTELVIDLRYNGGGGINVNEFFGDMLGRDLGGQVFETVAFRPSKSERNETYRFQVRPQSIAPTKIAFITSSGSASASEAIINGMVPYLGNNIALIGENTFGKPVGQSAFDLSSDCDTRLRLVTLQLENANGQGDYYNGLADFVPNTCRARDDIFRNFGDPQEEMLATALDFLAGRTCTPIAGGPATTQRIGVDLLQPELQERTPAQHDTPGLF